MIDNQTATVITVAAGFAAMLVRRSYDVGQHKARFDQLSVDLGKIMAALKEQEITARASQSRCTFR